MVRWVPNSCYWGRAEYTWRWPFPLVSIGFPQGISYRPVGSNWVVLRSFSGEARVAPPLGWQVLGDSMALVVVVLGGEKGKAKQRLPPCWVALHEQRHPAKATARPRHAHRRVGATTGIMRI